MKALTLATFVENGQLGGIVLAWLSGGCCCAVRRGWVSCAWWMWISRGLRARSSLQRRLNRCRSCSTRSAALLEVGDLGAWSSAWERIAAQQLALEPLDGGARVEEFLLHIDGGTARLRY